MKEPKLNWDVVVHETVNTGQVIESVYRYDTWEAVLAAAKTAWRPWTTLELRPYIRPLRVGSACHMYGGWSQQPDEATRRDMAASFVTHTLAMELKRLCGCGCS